VPDHVAVELEFLYLLIYRENEARRDGNRIALATVIRQRRRFLDEHLGRWITPFSDAIRAGAQSSFYRHLADATANLVSAV
jgi:TorA maturation chaperone TorD